MKGKEAGKEQEKEQQQEHEINSAYMRPLNLLTCADSRIAPIEINPKIHNKCSNITIASALHCTAKYHYNIAMHYYISLTYSQPSLPSPSPSYINKFLHFESEKVRYLLIAISIIILLGRKIQNGDKMRHTSCAKWRQTHSTGLIMNDHNILVQKKHDIDSSKAMHKVKNKTG